jgi:tetratricopeptide (TPR) repeat protein
MKYLFLALILTLAFASAATAMRIVVKDSWEDYLNRGTGLEHASLYQKAVVLYSTAMEVHPSETGFWHRKRADCYMRLNKFAEAVSDDKHHEKYMQQPSIEHAWFLASRPSRRRELEKEIKLLAKNERPITPRILYVLSALKSEVKDYASAARYLTRALDLIKDDREKSYKLLQRSELYEQMHHYGSALKDINTVLTLNSQVMEVSPDSSSLVSSSQKRLARRWRNYEQEYILETCYERRAKLLRHLGIDGAIQDVQCCEELKLKRFSWPLYKSSPKDPTPEDTALLEAVSLVAMANPFKVSNRTLRDAKLLSDIDSKLLECSAELGPYFTCPTGTAMRLNLSSNKHDLRLEYARKRFGIPSNNSAPFPLNCRLLYKREWGNLIFNTDTERPERVSDILFIGNSEVHTELSVFHRQIATDPPRPTTEEEERLSSRFRLPPPCYGRSENIATSEAANRAILVYSKLLDEIPADSEDREHALKQRALAYEFSNCYEESLADQRELIALKGKDQNAAVEQRLACARLLRKLFRRGDALSELNSLIDYLPGAIHREQQELLPWRAQEPTALTRQTVSARLARAEILTTIGRYREALEDYDKAPQTEEHIAEISLKRGKVRLLLGDPKGALDDFTAAANHSARIHTPTQKMEADQQVKVAKFFIEQMESKRAIGTLPNNSTN